MAILTTTLAIDANDLSRTHWRIVARQRRDDMNWLFVGGIRFRDLEGMLVCTGPSEDGMEFWLYAKHWRDGRRRFTRPQSQRGVVKPPESARRVLELV